MPLLVVHGQGTLGCREYRGPEGCGRRDSEWVLPTVRRDGWNAREFFGLGLFTSVGTGSPLTVNVTTQWPGDWCENEFWVDDSGATEHVTKDSAGFQDYKPVPAEHRVDRCQAIDACVSCRTKGS